MSTTIKVSKDTRDQLRDLALQTGLTLDGQIRKLLKRERQRRIGAQLASEPLSDDERMVLDAGAADVGNAIR